MAVKKTDFVCASGFPILMLTVVEILLQGELSKFLRGGERTHGADPPYIAISSDDTEKLARFYKEVFGFQKSRPTPEGRKTIY
jgi:hypothetical protein